MLSSYCFSLGGGPGGGGGRARLLPLCRHCKHVDVVVVTLLDIGR